jgi:hypothetical protein
MLSGHEPFLPEKGRLFPNPILKEERLFSCASPIGFAGFTAEEENPLKLKLAKHFRQGSATNRQRH